MRLPHDIHALYGLSSEESDRIRALLGREPNALEVALFSALWSEHCSYKSSRVHLKNLPTVGPRVLQGPGENAGIVDIGEGWAVVFKMESHNHPSFIEPFQGAATGVGGILRDIFTMGARPIASMNSLRFGHPKHPKTRYLVDGVVRGIGSYGNCVGVPNVGGETFFEECYNQNILVNAFALGLVRTDRVLRARGAGDSNPVIYVGSKTGRDGIHGAAMASEGFKGEADARKPQVQVGDPFTEKLLLEACMELAERDIVIGIQDLGAAGLASASAEMASRGNSGMDLELSSVPLREQGMDPVEIALSESQERMLLVVQKGSEGEVERIFQKWDLDAAVIGKVTSRQDLVLRWQGRTVVEVPISSLVGMAPSYERPAAKPPWQEDLQSLETRSIVESQDPTESLERLLGSPNIGSKDWVYQQYDYLVQSNTLVPPGSGAAVLRVKGTRVGLGLTVDGNSRFCYLDPYGGGVHAVAEAARNLACVGGEPIGVSDCLNFGNPEDPHVMWQFIECVRGIGAACRAFAIPIVSGNVSFYNETDGRSIFPTPTIAMVGLLPDARLRGNSGFQSEDDVIVLLGDPRSELGGSEYLKVIHGLIKGSPASVDLQSEQRLHSLCRTGIQKGLLRSAHDVSDGGLAVALAESCFYGAPGAKGAQVHVEVSGPRDVALFGESPGRIISSVAPSDLAALSWMAEKMGVPLQVLGRVTGEGLEIEGIACWDTKRLQNIWSGAFALMMGERGC
jgi:phosphoribosylformylglycinamidine synthase